MTWLKPFFRAQNRITLVSVCSCMVAERNTIPETPAAMSRSVVGSRRQPTLAEEIGELEKQERVTKALQATVEAHGMRDGIITSSPKGQKPHTKGSNDETPTRTPKKVQTPSPVKVDNNGEAWEMEDDHSEEDNAEEEEK